MTTPPASRPPVASGRPGARPLAGSAAPRLAGAALALLLAVGALSCQGKPQPCWRHPGKTQQDWHRDYSTCQARAGQAAGHQRDEHGTRMHRQVLEHCLLGEGWSLGSCEARR